MKTKEIIKELKKIEYFVTNKDIIFKDVKPEPRKDQKKKRQKKLNYI